MSDVFPSVPPVKTQAPANASTFNPSLEALTIRTEYLRKRLDLSTSTNELGAVVLQSSKISADVASGNTVAWDTTQNLYVPAVLTLDDEGKVLPTSVPAGLVTDLANGLATITVGGILTVPSGGVVASKETLNAGHWYLSHLEPGRLTQTPQAPALYVGTVLPTENGYAMIMRVDNVDGHAHHHIETIVYPAPSGTVQTDGGDPEIFAVLGYEPAAESVGIDNLARLSVVSTGSADATYTFVLSGDGTIAGSTVTWTTDNNSDEGAASVTGVQIPGFEVPFTVGDFGITLMLHRGSVRGTSLVYANASDYDTVFPSGAPVADRTFTLKMPEQGQGWTSHIVRQLDPLPGTDRGILIFGASTWSTTYGNSLAYNIVATAGGDITTGIALDITKPDSSVLNLASVLLGEIYTLGEGLYLALAPTYDTSVLGSDTTVGSFDTTINVTDEAPGSLLAYLSSQNPELARAIVGPTPRLEVNGLHLSLRDKYEIGVGSYKVATRALYWYHATSPSIPWSPDYVDYTQLTSSSIRRDVSIFTANPTSDSGVVTSLKAASGSAIRVTQQGTNSASSTGDLQLDLDLNFSTVPGAADQYEVVKAIRDDGTVESGPVVSRLEAGNGISFVNLSPGAPVGQGVFRIEATSGTRNGLFASTNLKGAQWTKIPNQDFYYVNMPPYYTANPTLQTGINLIFRVPTELTGNYKASFFATVFGLTPLAGTVALAGLKVAYTILPDLRTPASPDTDTYVPRNLLSSGASGFLAGSSSQRVTFGLAGTGYAAGDAILIHNDPNYTPLPGQVGASLGDAFPYDGAGDIDTITAGDTVSITITRDITSGTEYTGAIGILDTYWQLTEV